jgi:hypothetical protein
LLADQLIVSEPTANDLLHDEHEPSKVGALPFVEPEALLIGVGLQVVRLD